MSKAIAGVVAAALAWYSADERRRVAASVARALVEAARGVNWPEPGADALAGERRRAEIALDHARKGEQQARRALKKACKATEPFVIDVTATRPAPPLIPGQSKERGTA